LLSRIGPGVTSDDILDDAALELGEVVEETAWSAPEVEASVRSALACRGQLSRPVGMAIHDSRFVIGIVVPVEGGFSAFAGV
jgi:Xaa-Pro aminopeptidase